MADDPILTSGLGKHYGSATAVDDLTLRIRPGEIYGFLGLNGAGKTTTIRLLLGMIRPTTGWVEVFGTRIRPGVREVWTSVGYLVETPSAYPELSVRENLEIVRRLRHVADARAIERVVERLHLGPYVDRPARTLSLGNAQRLGLARALLHEPRLLILDEPTNGLDPAGVVEIRELLGSLAREDGVTIFISSHLLGEVARLATRIGVLHRGRLLQELTADELAARFHRWLVVDARDRSAARSILIAAGLSIEEDPGGGLRLTDERATLHPDDIARLLVHGNAAPTRLLVEHEDLETYFLRLVGAAGAAA
jgi:ABC-2 type transport system ATP-binding protein